MMRNIYKWIGEMKGNFWTTESPGIQRRGDLDVENGLIIFDEGYLVETMELLKRTPVAVSYVQRSFTNLEFTVFGDLDGGEKISILNATVGSYTNQMQEIRFLEIVEGTHIEQEPRYEAALFDFWLPHANVIKSWRLEGVVNIPQLGEVSIKLDGSAFHFSHLPHITRTEIERSLIHPLANLLMLLTHEVPRLANEVLTPSGADELERHTVRRKGAVSRCEELDLSIGSIMPLQYLQNAEVSNWFGINEALNPVCAVVGKTMSSSGISVESQVLHLAASVEAVHHAVHGTQRMSGSQAKKIRSRAVSAVPESEKSAVRDLLSGLQFPNFAERLEEMTNGIGPLANVIAGKWIESTPEDPRGRSAWVQAVRQHRNVFAHQVPHTPEDLRFFSGQMFVLFESLQWILTIALLAKVGIDRKKLSDEIQNISRFRLFQERAPKFWPSIYQPKT